MQKKSKVLYLTTVLPVIPITGGEIATCNFIDEIKRLGHEIDVVGYLREASDLPKGYFSAGIRGIESSIKQFQFWKWMYQSLMQGKPYSAQKFFSKQYLSLVESLIRVNEYSVVVIEHSQLYWLVPFLKKFKSKYKLIFSSQNIEFKLYEELGERTFSESFLLQKLYKRESLLMKEAEAQFIDGVDEVWCLTESDASGYKSYFGEHNYKVFPLVGAEYDLQGERNLNQKDQVSYDVVILGTWSWKPNHAGLKWFIDYIYPLLSKDIRIGIAGKGADWLVGCFEGVDYLGFVESAQDFLRSGKCIAIPSTEGGGVQIKTIDAIRIGRPVVTTSVGVRGLGQVPDDVFIVDNPKDFADQIMINLEAKESDSFEKHSTWFMDRQSAFSKIVQEGLRL